jgi:hypothetical protein
VADWKPRLAPMSASLGLLAGSAGSAGAGRSRLRSVTDASPLRRINSEAEHHSARRASSACWPKW